MLQLRCPQCGADVKFVNKASVYAACAHCSTLVVRKDVNLEALGKVAELQEDGSLLQIGCSGIWEGKKFEVIGRIQLRYEAGFWNEWHIHFGDGRSGWLGEAMGAYFVSFPHAMENSELTALGFDHIELGRTMGVGGETLTVMDKEKGQVVTFQGELPFAPQSYEAPVIDLAGETHHAATLDFSESPPLLFFGEWTAFEVLQFAGLRDPNDVRNMAPGGKLKSLQCPSCGAPHELRGGPAVQNLACEYCGTVIDVTTPQLNVIARARQAEGRISSAIPLGRRGTLQGTEWECIGVQQRACTVEGVNYNWREYLLYHPAQGYRFLVENNGHWSLVRIIHASPFLGSGIDNVSFARYNGRSYRHFQSVLSTVDYVRGEFFWKVQTGTHARVSDYVAPPYILSSEQSGNEMVWSVGEYLPWKAIWTAFNLGEGEAPTTVSSMTPFGVANNQPNPVRSGPYWAVYGLTVLLLLMMTIGFSAAALQKPVLSRWFEYRAADKEHAQVTDVFELPGRTSNVQVDVDARNSIAQRWASLDMVLINQDTGDAIDFDGNISWYTGVDDGEAWSEGSQTDSITVPSVPPGRYYLLVDTESGTGESPDPPGSGAAPNSDPDLKFAVTLTRDVPQWRWFWYAALLLVVWPCIQSYRAHAFEMKRWMESDHPMGTASTTTSED